jgi:predicted ATPase
LAVTFCFLGDFEAARKNATCGLVIWRSGIVQSPVEEVYSPAVICLTIEALSEWHLGEVAPCQAAIARAISLAKELNDAHGLAAALLWATILAHLERIPDKVARLASDLIELSTRQNFAFWLPAGDILRGWARSASGSTAEGTAWIEDAIRDYQATGAMLRMPYFLTLKAESLHMAGRTAEALDAIANAEAWGERSEERWWCAEIHRLRGIFLALIGAEDAQIEAAFCAGIRIAKEQKSVSLEKRAEATYAEYRRQKTSVSEGRGFRLPLW